MGREHTDKNTNRETCGQTDKPRTEKSTWRTYKRCTERLSGRTQTNDDQIGLQADRQTDDETSRQIESLCHRSRSVPSIRDTRKIEGMNEIVSNQVYNKRCIGCIFLFHYVLVATRLWCGRIPRLASDNFTCCHSETER